MDIGSVVLGDRGGAGTVTTRPAGSPSSWEEPSGAPVVVGVDGSLGVLTAVSWAAAEAARRGAELHLVHVRGAEAEPGDDPRARLHRAWGTAAAVAPHVGVTVVRESGRAGPALVDHAAGAALLVVGGRRRTDAAAPGDGTLAHLLAHAGRPLVVVPPRRTGAWSSTPSARPVLVGLTGGPGDARALDLAARTARRRRVPLLAVGEAGADDGVVPDLRARARLHGARWVGSSGDLVGTLRVAGRRAQLLVLSAPLPGAESGGCGSSGVEGLPSRSPCAVMVVPLPRTSPAPIPRDPTPHRRTAGGDPHEHQRPSLVEPAGI